MSTTPIEDFLPHYEPATLDEIAEALADLGVQRTHLGLRVDLPHTRRPDGTVDTIEIGNYEPTPDHMVYFGRCYRDDGTANVTATVGMFPGWMAVLAVRALHTYLSQMGAGEVDGTMVGRIVTALGVGPR